MGRNFAVASRREQAHQIQGRRPRAAKGTLARQQDPDVGSDREITEIRDLGAEVEASDGVKDGD